MGWPQVRRSTPLPGVRLGCLVGVGGNWANVSLAKKNLVHHRRVGPEDRRKSAYVRRAGPLQRGGMAQVHRDCGFPDLPNLPCFPPEMSCRHRYPDCTAAKLDNRAIRRIPTCLDGARSPLASRARVRTLAADQRRGHPHKPKLCFVCAGDSDSCATANPNHLAMQAAPLGPSRGDAKQSREAEGRRHPWIGRTARSESLAMHRPFYANSFRGDTPH